MKNKTYKNNINIIHENRKSTKIYYILQIYKYFVIFIIFIIVYYCFLEILLNIYF